MSKGRELQENLAKKTQVRQSRVAQKLTNHHFRCLRNEKKEVALKNKHKTDWVNQSSEGQLKDNHQSQTQIKADRRKEGNLQGLFQCYFQHVTTAKIERNKEIGSLLKGNVI